MNAADGHTDASPPTLFGCSVHVSAYKRHQAVIDQWCRDAVVEEHGVRFADFRVTALALADESGRRLIVRRIVGDTLTTRDWVTERVTVSEPFPPFALTVLDCEEF